MRHTKWMLLVALAACGENGGPLTHDAPQAATDAVPRQVVSETKQLLVGEIAEAVLAGGPGDAAVLSLAAPVAKLDWNIHGHAGGGTQTVKEEFGVMTASYAFAPTAHADWYLLLRNKDTAPMAVEVRIELFGTMQWSGWR